MSDQTVKADAGKPRLTLVPRKAAFRVAKVREYGISKYPEGGPDNWKRVEIERYRDAMMRHLFAYLDDPFSRDTESGLLHFDQFLTNAFFLAELEPDEPSGNIPVHVTSDLAPDKEPELKEQPQKLKKPYRRIDRGKVKALRAAGWEIKEIADEMQCSDQSVRNILNDKE